MKVFSINEKFHCQSVQYSPFNSREIACATAENFGLDGKGCVLILENRENGLVLKRRLYHKHGLYDLAWSEFNEHIIISVSNDGSIQCWDEMSELGLKTSFKAHDCEISSVEWSLTRDKPLFATASWDRTVKMWDPICSQPIVTVPDHNGIVYCLAWSPYLNGLLLTVSGDGNARVWDMRSGNLTNLVQAGSGELLSCDWTKYERTVFLTSGTDSSIKVWDLRNVSVPIHILSGHSYPARRIKCSPHNQHIIASASYDKTTRIWNYSLASHPIETFLHHSEFATGVDFNLKFADEIIECSWDMTLKLHHPNSLKLI